MQATRPLGIVALLVVVVAAAAFWFVTRGDGKVDLPAVAAGADAGGDAAAANAAVAGGAVAPPLPDGAVEATTRIEAASASSAPATGPVVIGQVVDEAGRPVSGAVVRNSRDFDFDPSTFDPDQIEDLMGDPDSVMAKVRAARADGVETVTDADGRFRLAAPSKAGGLSLRVLARGFQQFERTVARPTENDLDLGVLQLERGAIVTGHVVDRSGKGIADAVVVREPAGTAEWLGFDFDTGGDEMPGFRTDHATTDAEGRFELTHALPGDFTLRARHADHPSTRQQGLSVAAGAELRDVSIVLEPGATIRGRVVGVADGAKALRVVVGARREAGGGETDGPLGMFALAGAEGIGEGFGGFGERSVKAEADGTFLVRGLHIGRAYRVWATQSGRGFLGGSACTERLEVTTPVEGIELRYDAGISVTFQVVADDGGAPIEQLWVGQSLRGGGGMEELMQQAMNRRGRAKSYPDGRVTIANLRPKDKQTLTLGVDAVGFRSYERKDIAVPQKGELDLGVVRLVSVPVLHVQVLANADGEPVAGVSVRARAVKSDAGTDDSARVEFDFFGGGSGGGSAAGSARSGADGRCVLNAPVDKPFVVVVTSKEFASFESAPMTLTALGGKEFVARLLRGGTVEVTVVDSDGAIAPAQRVVHRGPDQQRGNENTGDNGVATFTQLVPGEHRFRVGEQSGPAYVRIAMDVASEQAGGEEQGWQVVRVEDGATATLRLTRPASSQLHGVVRENGLPMADARITFLKGDDSALAGDLAAMMAEFGGGGGGGGHSARTGDDGSYQLRDLPEGSHRLRITTKGRAMPAIVAVELHGPDNVVDVDLDVAIVRGVVRDADGAPVDGASVRVTPARSSDGEPDPTDVVEGIMPGGLGMLGGGGGNRSAKTDATGHYELRGVQSGAKLQVRVTAKDSAPAVSAPFEVQAGAVRDGVDLQLERAGRIKVTMTEKVPFAMAMARRLDASGEPEKGETPVMQMMGNGSGTLKGLRAGRWRVTVQTPSGDSKHQQDVDVTAGQTATIAF